MGTLSGNAIDVSARRASGRLVGALAGAAGAGVALGVTELVSGLNPRVPPLIVAVGDVVIDRAPRAVIESGVAGFGARSKGALLAGVVVTALLAGALLGAASARRRWPAVVGFSAFGILGAMAGARDPQALPLLAAASAVLAVEIGLATC
ncbi:MAG: hypothetical protein ACRDWD_16150, partial [Acidimicrobiia bacterium]